MVLATTNDADSFRSKLREEIAANGPMRLDDFFSRANAFYYGNQTPLGRDGDFITAPLVSQLFGEMIAFWIIENVKHLERFKLLELGPGNGQMMADVMRIIRKDVATNSKLEAIYLYEFSQALKEQQAAAVQDPRLAWCESLASLEGDSYVVIANEFFDALPFRQFSFGQVVQELFVGVQGSEFVPVWLESDELIDGAGIIEISDCSLQFASEIDRITKGGAVLIFDYGYFQRPGVSTLQALLRHQKVDPFAAAGRGDLTYHVDFVALAEQFVGRDVNLMTQAQFLLSMGIELRAGQLIKGGASPLKIEQDLRRLLSGEQMGNLFKVMEIRSKP